MVRLSTVTIGAGSDEITEPGPEIELGTVNCWFCAIAVASKWTAALGKEENGARKVCMPTSVPPEAPLGNWKVQEFEPADTTVSVGPGAQLIGLTETSPFDVFTDTFIVTSV